MLSGQTGYHNTLFIIVFPFFRGKNWFKLGQDFLNSALAHMLCHHGTINFTYHQIHISLGFPEVV